MELPKITGFLWCYLTILLTFGQVLTAQGPTGGEWELTGEEPIPAADSLQIKLDRDLYKKQGSIVYSSHLEFDETPQISDRQLYKIARDAFNEMRGMAHKNGLDKQIPHVMATLLVGKELIFASSAKGPKHPADPESQVQGDLAECATEKGKSHKNGGRCGEVMAFHKWYNSHVRSEPLGKDSGARIVAISMQTNAKGKPEPLIMAPCGNDEKWGCNLFLKDVNVLDDAKVANDKEMSAFRYKNLIAQKKLKPAATAPKPKPGNNDPPKFDLAPRPNPKSKLGQSSGNPPKNDLAPRPNGKPGPGQTGGNSGNNRPKTQTQDSVDPPPNDLPPRPKNKPRPNPPQTGGNRPKTNEQKRPGRNKQRRLLRA